MATAVSIMKTKKKRYANFIVGQGEGTVVAPENSPIAKYCQENGANFRPITEEEDAVRREKTEAAAADLVYQDE